MNPGIALKLTQGLFSCIGQSFRGKWGAFGSWPPQSFMVDLIRDYLSQLHVPIPPLDSYFAAPTRSLLAGRDLTVKLIAMQLLVEGMAFGTFQFLSQARVEPVLSEILPYIERDESRHVGLFLESRAGDRPSHRG